MADVQIEGVFMGANIKTTTFDGNSKTKLNIDIYQPSSESNDKAIQVSSDQIDLFQQLSTDYAIGSLFKCSATVNAYKNKAYFKLDKIIS